jgi:hypothetical protein
MSYDPTDAFFVTEAYGGMAKIGLLTNTAGTTAEVPVIFDRDGTLMVVSDIAVQTAKPQAVIRTKDLPAAENETSAIIIIEGVTYKIDVAHIDAGGVTTLILSKD